MSDVAEALQQILPAEHVLAGDDITEDYTRDETLSYEAGTPAVVVRPGTAEDVAAICRLASERGTPIVARGSGTGLSGAAIPPPDAILISFERMNAIVEIDTENHVAVVQPGVTLAQLDEALAPLGLVYPVHPGETSGSLGGNAATNAGGMRAVKYGVTRNQIIGLQCVLADGRIIRTGGKLAKSSTGYDLTQLIIGSEGTLALVTEAILKLHPRLPHRATVLAPFRTLEEITRAVPRIVASGVGPMILEYIDAFTMAAITAHVGLDLGIPDAIKETATAYLVVVMESARPERLDEDVTAVGELVTGLDAMDVYILPPQAGQQLIEAREKAFWTAKAANAADLVDIVVPRAAIAEFFTHVVAIAAEHETFLAGCGHAGDGNVHLSVFQPDPDKRYRVMRALFEAGMSVGGAISGEHGIGRSKKKYFLELEDPTKIELMRGIKKVFDPRGILNPGTLFD
ncbi:MAG TPA: FAD-binding oxidoreductase [Actinomycetota bacterium]